MPRWVPVLVASVSKLLMKGLCKVDIEGREKFLELVRNGHLLTFSNHISLLDEPLTPSAVLPLRYFWSKRRLRYVPGASDIIYKNAFLRWFFNSGQTIEFFRGNGIYQRGMNKCIDLLNDNRWVHIFPEGHIGDSANGSLDPFKWGIARFVLEAESLPVIVPIWIEGLDRFLRGDNVVKSGSQGMDEDKKLFFLGRFRKNTNIRIKLGDPIEPIEELEQLRKEYKAVLQHFDPRDEKPHKNVTRPTEVYDEPAELAELRIKVVNILEKELAKFSGKDVRIHEEKIPV